MNETAHEEALRQLESALRLYFEKEDYYSVITLAGASEEIFGQLVIRGGGENSLASLKRDVSAVHKALYTEDLEDKEISDRANEARNSLKHYSEDRPKIDVQNEAIDMLNRAIDNYFSLTGTLTAAMEKFQYETVTNNAQLRSLRSC